MKWETNKQQFDIKEMQDVSNLFDWRYTKSENFEDRFKKDIEDPTKEQTWNILD